MGSPRCGSRPGVALPARSDAYAVVELNDCDVGPRGFLEPQDGVWIELALDPRPRTGCRVKRPGAHDLLGRPPGPGIVVEHRRLVGLGARGLPRRTRQARRSPRMSAWPSDSSRSLCTAQPRPHVLRLRSPAEIIGHEPEPAGRGPGSFNQRPLDAALPFTCPSRHRSGLCRRSRARDLR
jgi:hypothetical protein